MDKEYVHALRGAMLLALQKRHSWPERARLSLERVLSMNLSCLDGGRTCELGFLRRPIKKVVFLHA